jgi:hypothetical protein
MPAREKRTRRARAKREPGFLGVSLHIWGRFDSDLLSQQLGLEPVISDRRDTLVGRARIRHDYLLVGFKPTASVDATLMEIVRHVRRLPIAARKKFTRFPGPAVEISIERAAGEQTSEFNIRPATLKSLASLGLALAIGVY